MIYFCILFTIFRDIFLEPRSPHGEEVQQGPTVGKIEKEKMREREREEKIETANMRERERGGKST